MEDHRKEELPANYADNNYERIVRDFIEGIDLEGLSPDDLEMILWACHHFGLLIAKEKHPLYNAEIVRLFSLTVADKLSAIAKKGEDKGVYRVKPLSLWYLNRKEEALALVAKGRKKYSADLGISNTEVALLRYMGDSKGCIVAAVIGHGTAVPSDRRLAGNFAQQISRSLENLGSLTAARGWLIIAIRDWKASEKQTQKNKKPFKAKNHIQGARAKIKELDSKIAAEARSGCCGKGGCGQCKCKTKKI